MAALDLLLRLVRLSPEVASPGGDPTSVRRKASAYTAVSLLVFLAGSRLPLYGIDHRSTTAAVDDPFYWIHAASASNRGTLMALGVYPVLASEVATHLLLGLKVLKVRIPDEQRMQHFIDGLQKLLGILIAIVLSIANVLSTGTAGQFGIANAILVALQLFLGGLVIIYLDQVLKKGHGLFHSGISLFAATNICASIFLKASGKLAGDDFPMMMIVSTCAFLALVVKLQGLYVPLPVRTREDMDEPRLQANCAINLSYLSYAPIIFQSVLVSTTCFLSEVLYVRYGENSTLVNLLGKWKLGSTLYSGRSVPVSGVAYYITTPPTLSDVTRDPVHAVLYASLLLAGCAVVSAAWFTVRVYSKKYVVMLLGDRQVRVTPAQPASLPLNGWKRRVVMVAFLVGFCVGALTLLAGFMGVSGSGTGIMLVVTVMYSCFRGRAQERLVSVGL